MVKKVISNLIHMQWSRDGVEIELLLFATGLDEPFVKSSDIIGDTFLLPPLHKPTEPLQECVHSLFAGDSVEAVLVQYVLPHNIQNFLQMLVVSKTVVFMVE